MSRGGLKKNPSRLFRLVQKIRKKKKLGAFFDKINPAIALIKMCGWESFGISERKRDT